MPLTADDLTEAEEIDYWNQLQLYARRGREKLVSQKRLRKRMETSQVSSASMEEILAKEEARLRRDKGPMPTPDSVRAQKTQGD